MVTTGKGDGGKGRGESRSRRLGAFGVGGLPGVAGCGRVVGCCWVPAPDRVRGRLFAGMTGARRARDGGWARRGVFSRSGECVQAVGRMCSVLGAMCSVFRRMCSLLRAMCSVFGGARPPSRPPSAGSEQVLRGRRDDGGSGREAGVSAPWHVGPMCPVLGLMCPVLGGAPWLGMGHGRKARFLGSAALRSE